MRAIPAMKDGMKKQASHPHRAYSASPWSSVVLRRSSARPGRRIRFGSPAPPAPVAEQPAQHRGHARDRDHDFDREHPLAGEDRSRGDRGGTDHGHAGPARDHEQEQHDVIRDFGFGARGEHDRRGQRTRGGADRGVCRDQPDRGSCRPGRHHHHGMKPTPAARIRAKCQRECEERLFAVTGSPHRGDAADRPPEQNQVIARGRRRGSGRASPCRRAESGPVRGELQAGRREDYYSRGNLARGKA